MTPIIALTPSQRPFLRPWYAHVVLRYTHDDAGGAFRAFMAASSASGRQQGQLASVPPLGSVNLALWVTPSMTRAQFFDATHAVAELATLRALHLVPTCEQSPQRLAQLAQLAHRCHGLPVDVCLSPAVGRSEVLRCSSYVAGAVPLVSRHSEFWLRWCRFHARHPYTAALTSTEVVAAVAGNRVKRPVRDEAAQIELGIPLAERAPVFVAED